MKKSQPETPVEESPLKGLRIVVTRAAHQAEELAGPLRTLGAEVMLLPMIAISPPADPEPLISAAQHAVDYHWIVFTSANAVESFANHLRAIPAGPRIAAVGAATREAAEKHGFAISLLPREYTAESLAEAFVTQDLIAKRILIPRAAAARDVVPDKLRELGARVDIVEAYRNVLPESSAALAQEIFRDPLPDWVLLASPSAVQNLVQLCGKDVLHRIHLASIGPVTSATIAGLGLNVKAEADPHTTEGLVQAVLRTHMASCKHTK